MPLFGFLKRYNILSKIEKAAQYGLINVYYPRFITPKVLYSFYSLWYYIGIIPTVKKLVNRKKYDYIIAFWAFPDGVAAVKIGQRFGLPVFVKVLGCDINQLPKRKDLRKQIRKSLSIANGIIAVSHPLKENVVALGITEDNILVAENGIDDTVFHLRETSAISKKLGYPEKQKTILYIGRFSEEKNPMLLLEAVHLLKEGGCRFRVVICGWGEMQHQMLQYTKDNELEDIVYFLGELKHHQVAEHMSCADVLCLSSRREGYPNVLIEAISCGLPVVATRVGGVPTIVVEGRNGLTVEPENPEDMANKLKQALSHEWNRQVVKETLQVPTWKEVAEKTMEWIQQRI
ncbi:MAG: glycosyltransferase [Pseudomonadota bacterium]